MSDELKPKSGLYVTATPIGNLEDISKRALLTLKGVDAIVCEDTRVSRKLLSAFGIKKPLISCHEHNEKEMLPGLLGQLKDGRALALISDAGSPLISDPGYRLVQAAAKEGIPVIPIPGPSAVISALVVSGLSTDAFYFGGFLPPKAGQREAALEAVSEIPATLVFFESAGRLPKTLAAMVKVFGPGREAVLAREMTKLHEEVLRRPLGELLEVLQKRGPIKGEVVLLVGKGKGREKPAEYDEVLKALLKSHSVSDAAAALSKLTGRPRKEIYSRALKLKK